MSDIVLKFYITLTLQNQSLLWNIWLAQVPIHPKRNGRPGNIIIIFAQIRGLFLPTKANLLT